MKIRLLQLSVLGLLSFSLTRTIAADLASPRLTVEMRDGSRVVGLILDKKLQFHSALLGKLDLPVQDIRTVDCADTNSATLITTAGDTLAVSFMDSALALKTSFGKVDLPVVSILKVTVARTVPGSNLPGLVALWQGDERGKDLAGGHDATVSPGITYVEAKTGPGFYFDGGANKMLVPDAPNLNFGPGQDFSIEAWIEPSPPPPQMTDDILPIVDKRQALNSIQCQGYVLCFYHGRLSFRMSDDINGDGSEWNATVPGFFYGWFHQVAVTVDRNSKEGGKLYVDAKLVATFDPTQESGDLSNTQPLRIGNNSCQDYYSFFHGLIDNVAVFNRALSPEEIKSLCPTDNSGVPLPMPRTMSIQVVHPLYHGIYDYPDPMGRAPHGDIP